MGSVVGKTKIHYVHDNNFVNSDRIFKSHCWPLSLLNADDHCAFVMSNLYVILHR